MYLFTSSKSPEYQIKDYKVAPEFKFAMLDSNIFEVDWWK